MELMDQRAPARSTRETCTVHNEELVETRHLFGDVVIVKTEDNNRGKWPQGIIESLIVGNDGVVGRAKLRAGKSYMERAIQQLYPLELSCDRQMAAPRAGVNLEAAPFRPRRDAAVAARGLRLQEITQEEY